MLIDGNAVHYLLSQVFDEVSCDKAARRMMVDYPILYDEGADMSGHTVLMPEYERPHKGLQLEGSICLCVSDGSADAARNAGFAAIQVSDDVTFPRLYNYLQLVFVRLERLDARLRAFVETRTGTQALLDACAEVLNCPLALIDEQYRSICEALPENAGAQEFQLSSRPNMLELRASQTPGILGRLAAGPSNATRPITEAPLPESEPDTPESQLQSTFGMLEEEGIDLFMAARNYRHMRSSRNVFTVPGSGDLLMKNLFVGGELKGMVMSRHEGTALSARYVRFVLKYMGGFIEQMHERMGSFGVEDANTNRTRNALSRLLPGGSANQAEIESLLIKSGHAQRSGYVVLRIERSFTYEGAEGLDYLAKRFESTWAGAYCFTADENLFMLADVRYEESSPDLRNDKDFGKGWPANADPGARDNLERRAPDHQDFLKEILIVARDNLAKVGVSREFEDMSKLDAARLQAEAALQQGCITDPTFWFYRFDDYALSWIVEHGLRGVPSEYVAHPAVEALTRYDAEHGSELLHTLAMFLRHRFNATRAAGELYVARSTLLARLERITALTGLDFDDPADLVYLSLSLV